ncbi:MAG: DNA-processing protein DprA [Clostridia bacterium]|nr:DNA-processing protein DprA [Clostridia bacterium]
MKPQEQGYLLLCCTLGQKDAEPLRLSELRALRRKMHETEPPKRDRELRPEDLLKLGYPEQTAQRIVSLLQRQALLQAYLSELSCKGITPVTCVSSAYPARLKKLGDEAPAVLFAKGDVSLLQKRAIALVGSRDLRPDNAVFAATVGAQAAQAGFALVSGNASGADRAAQEAALIAGGTVISFVADRLEKCRAEKNIVYLSEDGTNVAFSTFRALRRNAFIHALAETTYVAQCAYGHGGTWAGARQNLDHGYSPVFVFQDDTEGPKRLCELGAVAVDTPEIK